MLRFDHRIALLTAFLIAGCSFPGDAADLSARQVPLHPQQPELRRVGALEFLGGLELRGGRRFGGLSALLADGAELTALSDTGQWYRYRLEHGPDGALVGAVPLAEGVLKDPQGQPLSGKLAADSESMARYNGGIAVSFEQDHRVHVYSPDLDAPARVLDVPSAVQDLPFNGGIEAMAELPAGRLLMIAEGQDNVEFSPGWIGRPGTWTAFRYRREGLFKATGAALLPSGDVVVLERRFSLLGGLAARLVRIDPGKIEAGALVGGQELARLEPPLMVDNFEAVTAVRRADGRTVVYVVSDDNHSPLQSTLLFAFLIP